MTKAATRAGAKTKTGSYDVAEPSFATILKVAKALGVKLHAVAA